MSNEEQRHREQPVIKARSLSTDPVYEPTRTTRRQRVTYHCECPKSLLQSSSLVDLRLQCAARAAASSVWAAAAARVTRQCRFLDFQRRPSSRHLLRISSEGSYFSGALHSRCRPGGHGGGGLGLGSSAATFCHALLVSLSLLRVHRDANFAFSASPGPTSEQPPRSGPSASEMEEVTSDSPPKVIERIHACAEELLALQLASEGSRLRARTRMRPSCNGPSGHAAHVPAG